jgi:cobalt-zinc-cadmium efflux system protein
MLGHHHHHGHDHGGHDHGGHNHGEHNHGHGKTKGEIPWPDHPHAPPPEVGPRDPRRALGWALALNGVYLGVEATVGLWTGSLALLSDAAHMLSDVAALALALGAAQLARSRPSSTMTYGLGRAEVLGAFTNGVLLVVACGWIALEAIGRLWEGPPPLPGWPVLAVGALGLAINLGSAAALFRADPHNLNVRGAMVHMLADALGSVGAVVAAILLLLGFPSADPIISAGIAALVLWTSVRVLVDSGRVLLELPPRGFDVLKLRAALEGVAGVKQVHDLHVWTVDGYSALVSAHLVVEGEGVDVCQRARAEAAAQFGVRHATFQVETQGDCGSPCA